jgi:hypothetical protein
MPAGNSALNSSFPDGLNSGVQGREPQPTNRSPLRAVCAFPHDPGDQALGLVVGLDQGRHVVLQVQPDGDHPAVAEQRAAGLVVEERVLTAADGLGIMLPGEDLAVAPVLSSNVLFVRCMAAGGRLSDAG